MPTLIKNGPKDLLLEPLTTAVQITGHFPLEVNIIDGNGKGQVFGYRVWISYSWIVLFCFDSVFVTFVYFVVWVSFIWFHHY